MELILKNVFTFGGRLIKRCYNETDNIRHIMNQESRSNRCKILLLIHFILLVFTCNLSAQMQLLKTDSIKCLYEDYNFKPIFEQNWINDTTLQIKTTAQTNCIGVYNPRIRLRGPLLNLEFDSFKTDTAISPITHRRGEQIVASCNCVYQIIWQIKGRNKKDEYIVLLNGEISRDYKKSLLDRLLRDYYIEDNIKKFYLRNVIDKKGQKQGYHLNRIDKRTELELYSNGIKQNE